ncbi:hypothetical protein H4R18_004860 [Coemansia javaensis]|uniref:Major facilitator superfamily (MFS) profile domain-containing protein n=1 Tax=Coemansia javaensis TaxID=2761396 RepID=A0A9W8H3S0_9FUNG|nr:hypothetical protein H4R18_004860 [Coemansia javaensis]
MPGPGSVWRWLGNVDRVRAMPALVVAGSCIAQFIDNTIYSISFACLPHLFEDMQLASKAKIGLVMAMFGVGSVITSVLAGVVSDRWKSRKLPLVIGSAGYVASGLVLGLSHKLWHVLLYRVLNGMASGLVYPITTAAVADVRPKKLLGLQMSLLGIFNSAGYMVGPVMGGALYDRIGVRGISSVIMVSGGFLALLLAFGIKEPLDIRSRLVKDQGPLQDTAAAASEAAAAETKDDCSDITVATGPTFSEEPAPRMPLWRLVLQWQVLSASVIALSVGVLTGSLDNVLAIHAKDRFGVSASKAGLIYTINGGVAIVLSIPVGSGVDWAISRHGETARAGIVSAGLCMAGGAALAMGLSTAFGTIVGAEALLASGLLLVNIPVMSSFGDFVNSLGINSMAQSYGVYNSFWSVSSLFAPPIATWLYTRIGFRAIVAGLLPGLCALCAALMLAEAVWQAAASRRRAGGR